MSHSPPSTPISPDAHLARQELARQLALTRGITDSMAQGLYAVDREGRVTFVNPAAERLLGYAAEELLGRNMHELIHHRHGDPSSIPAEACPLLGVIRTGKPVRIEEDIFTRRDGQLLSVAYSSAPIIEEGTVAGAVVAFHDISQSKRDAHALRESRGQLLAALEALREEREALERRILERTAELHQANERLEISNRELQDFASVASHDLQEPLRKIQAFGDRLETRCAAALGVEGQDYLRRIRNAAKRMQSLIGDLLDFSRVSTRALPPAPVDLNAVAREVVVDLEEAIQRNGGRVELGELPTLDADPLQMRQLLQNLIANALKFRKPDAPPIVRVECQSQEPGSVQLLVQDNGIGFDEKYLDRIFNVFQRLHGRGTYEGTGIGLAICRKIAERHGGSITARSQPGVGSTFIVTLPRHHNIS